MALTARHRVVALYATYPGIGLHEVQFTDIAWPAYATALDAPQKTQAEYDATRLLATGETHLR